MSTRPWAERGDYPEWLHPIVETARRLSPEDLTSIPTPSGEWRLGAVLMLFGESDGEPDLLIIERAHDMRSHAGQPAFPGGGIEQQDGGPIDAAVREAEEETGLDPSGIDIVATLPQLWLPPSGFTVTPVMAWWRDPSPVRVVDPVEVASVHRITLAEFIDPANRLVVRHPSGFSGPAFTVRDLFVWGFTGGLVAGLLSASGLEQPWDRTRVEDLPPRMLEMALRSEAHPGFVASELAAARARIERDG
jgi:8-oxo-dGTP pyrophosphatase MutT (NUDIX family)